MDPDGEEAVVLWVLLNYAFGQSLPPPDRPYSEAFDSGMKMAMFSYGVWLLCDAGRSISSVMIQETKNVKVIGRFQDTVISKDWEGHEVLNVKNWTLAKNDAWITEGIINKQNFYIASPITETNLWDFIAGRETVFAREINMLLEAGYVPQGDYLIHPSNL